ncbi:MAG: hypothetical protein LT102_07855 [Burkholderiaceae bacterium]|nr:hypothetical protein [Burkholderiaceae bacterium]
MNRRTLMASVLATALSLPAVLALAADRQEPIYGSQLMTQQERDEYRYRMRAAKTAQEREQIRADHHERMKERAQARGVAIPDEPPARGGGRPANGRGAGRGAGPGGAASGGGGGGGR